MSAFEGTPLDIVLRDCGVRAFLIAGVAAEVGIEPTVRHSTDLGYIPIVVQDALRKRQRNRSRPSDREYRLRRRGITCHNRRRLHSSRRRTLKQPGAGRPDPVSRPALAAIES